MKIRNGFVSNSSSSSFIIAVPMSGCTTLGQLQDYLFSDDRYYPNVNAYSDDDVHSWPVSEVADEVFRDIHNQEPWQKAELIEEYQVGYTPEYEAAEDMAKQQLGIDNIYGISHEEWERYFNIAHEIHNKLATETIEHFIASNPEHFFYVLTYSDNDGEFQSALEHGPLFIRIPHLTVSHH